MTTRHLELFSECRPSLLSLAGRMLGDQTEAEDMVQETYLRWQKTVPEQIKCPKAFLTTTLTRLCLNQLNLARVRLVHDEGTIAPDELHGHTPGPDEHAELADALTEAFGRMLANLSPTETAVFLLREAFDFDYSEIAPIVERTPENCRQILKRARDRMARGQAPNDTPSQQHRRMVQVFREAVTTGELDSLLDMLSKDAVLVRDGGDLSRPSRSVSGPALLQELRTLADRFFGVTARFQMGALCGKPLLLADINGNPSGAFLLNLQKNRLKSISVITCPMVLRHLRILLAFQSNQFANN